MSLSTGLFAIKGQHTDRLSEVFGFFKLVDTGEGKVLNNWDEVAVLIDEEYMNRDDNSQRRVVWFDNGWTIIEDLSLMLCTDEENLAKIANYFSAPVFYLATQGASNCYAFWYFDKQKIRAFFKNEGEVIENFGSPLSQEKGFSVNENAFYDDIHGIAKRFGIDWANVESLNFFIVKLLENSEEINNDIEQMFKNIIKIIT